jgi:hypothetical protein
MFKILAILLAFNFVWMIAKGAKSLFHSSTFSSNTTFHTDDRSNNQKVEIDKKLKGITDKISKNYAEDIEWEEI